MVAASAAASGGGTSSAEDTTYRVAPLFSLIEAVPAPGAQADSHQAFAGLVAIVVFLLHCWRPSLGAAHKGRRRVGRAGRLGQRPKCLSWNALVVSPKGFELVAPDRVLIDPRQPFAVPQASAVFSEQVLHRRVVEHKHRAQAELRLIDANQLCGTRSSAN